MKRGQRLRVFEIRLLKKTFRPERDQVTRNWKRWHSDGLHELYFSPYIIWVNKSRIMRLAGLRSRMGERRGTYRVLMRKPEERRSLVRPRRGWEDDIKMDLQGIGSECGRD